MATSPDAILFPSGFDPGGPGQTLQDRIFDFLEQQLGGKPVYINDTKWQAEADGSHLRFATLSAHNTMLQPSGHPAEKQARYAWVKQSSGAQFGTLVPGSWPCVPGKAQDRTKPVPNS